MQKITPCLWFEGNAEEAVTFYRSVFKDSKILSTTRYGEAGTEIHRMPAGAVLTISFELNGQEFTALNAGPEFKFTEAVSFQVFCETQEELDDYWEKLSAGGDPEAQQCGWLKDKFGLSWQIVPSMMQEVLVSEDAAKRDRVMSALLKMHKLDIATLQKAADG